MEERKRRRLEFTQLKSEILRDKDEYLKEIGAMLADWYDLYYETNDAYLLRTQLDVKDIEFLVTGRLMGRGRGRPPSARPAVEDNK